MAKEYMSDQSATAELARLAEEVKALRAELAEAKSLCAPFGMAMPDGTVLVQTVLGNRYFVPADDYSMMPKLVGNRVWEPRVTSLMSSIIKPGMTVIDVGANFGYYTCLAGSIMGRTPDSQVLAIEPNPSLAALIERNVYINWSMAPVEVLMLAVGDRTGTRDLHIPKGLVGQASLTQPTRGLDRSGKRRPELTRLAVEVETLDNLLPPPSIAHVLKVDVEGEELSVLTGARQLIERSLDIQIVVEWSFDHLSRNQGQPERLVDLICELGVNAYHIEAKAKPITPRDLLELTYGNVWMKRN